MKSLRLLTKIYFIILPFLVPCVHAQDQSADDLFQKAKYAYQKPDCQATLLYLDEYLKVGSPSAHKLSSIQAVRQWCKKFLAEGIKSSSAFGFMDINKEPELTKQGKQMLKTMPKL